MNGIQCDVMSLLRLVYKKTVAYVLDVLSSSLVSLSLDKLAGYQIMRQVCEKARESEFGSGSSPC